MHSRRTIKVKNFSNDEYEYIKGNKLAATGKKFSIPGDFYSTGRTEFLKHITKNKVVLHVGFANHLEEIDNLIKNKQWLNNEIIQVASLVVGTDINAVAVNYIKKNTCIENIYCIDVAECLPDGNKKYDNAIIPDVLEHMDNPVDFLRKFNETSSNYLDEIIITVPNAWHLFNLKMLFFKKEYINSDHRYWFTPFTLAKVLDRSGWVPKQFWFVDYDTSKIKYFFLKSFVRFFYRCFFKLLKITYPCFASTIAVKAVRKTNQKG